MTREEAIDFLKEEKFKNVNSKYRRDWNDASDMAIEALQAEPVKHGKWIEGDILECSQCYHRMIVGGGAYNFCPNCGAKMDKD